MRFKKWIKFIRVCFWAIMLWTVFTFGCYIAPILAIAILIPCTRKLLYMQRFVRAVDRLCAAMLGFSGRQMLSTELIHCQHLKWMRDALNEIDEHHCEESAYEEGAYCRLSDRSIGHR